jgi:nitroreductase
MSDILETIFKRRSIRQFTSQPVSRELLIQLLEAAMAAPSAVNRHPWEFIVVSEHDRLKALKEKLPYAKYNAPAAILVCGNLAEAQTGPDGSFWVQDCSAATENLLIAAAGLGLGTVWTAVYPNESLIHEVCRQLAIPAGVLPLNLILVGYPAEEKPARTQYDEKRVHWETY